MDTPIGSSSAPPTRPGSRWLKGALGVAALTQTRSNKTYFSAKYKRIAFRRGELKALVSVEHAMLTAIWHMLTTGELYNDPGPDYFTRRTPAKAKARAISQLESLGYHVTIEPISEAAETKHLSRHVAYFHVSRIDQAPEQTRRLFSCQKEQIS